MEFILLGLRALTVIDDCIKSIEANTGERVIPDDLPLETYCANLRRNAAEIKPSKS